VTTTPDRARAAGLVPVAPPTVRAACTADPPALPGPPVLAAVGSAAEEGGRLRELRAAARPPLQRTLLRYGVTPFLVVLDLAAWAIACQLAGWHVRDIALAALIVALYSASGLYRSRLTLAVLDDATHLVGRAAAAAATVVAVEVLVSGAAGQAQLLLSAGLFVVAVLLLRSLGYCVVRSFRARGLVGHPTLILGAGRVGAQIAALLCAHPEYGLKPVGFLDRDPLLAEAERPIPVLGGDDALAETIVEFGVRDVVVAFGSLPESAMVEVIRTCDRLECEIFFVPRLFELHSTSREMDHVWGLPLVRLRRAAFRSPSWHLKRALDVALSGAALTVLAPVLGAVALAVRLEGGPRIIFRQTRVGLDNRPFEVLKFRSLRPVDDAESQTLWNVKHDDRLGPVGKFIRSTSLDELPQLWNILRGDMSLVGPRPERPHFVDTFASTLPRYVARHRVPAGLTGWAQVHGLRGDTSIEERARFDNYYIENWSLWLDLRILAMTVSSVLRRAGG